MLSGSAESKLGVFGNDGVRALEDGSGRAPIFRKNDQLRFQERFLEQFEGSARSSAEAVNSLVRITYSEDILIGAGKRLQNFKLGKVRILKLIDQNEACTGTCALQQRRL